MKIKIAEPICNGSAILLYLRLFLKIKKWCSSGVVRLFVS
nr:MAG TPA: hypothetical protein [Caudoviricetes sp.]